MTVFFSIILCIIAALLFYFHLARRYNITDVPNARSSHRKATIRGAGIIFPLAALLWFFFNHFSQPWMILGLLIIAIISFTDDLVTLPGRWRLLAQAIATALMFFQAGILGLPWYLMIPAFIITLGWINGFNFMDGINAITPFYSVVALGSFIYLNYNVRFVPPELPYFLTFSVVIFSFFNARKNALAFAGDVGSVSMAYLLAFLMLALVMKTGRYEYILFFSIYALDIVFTILYRLMRHENIFKAHRSHLYQWLSNEIGWPHVLVSLLYALVQLIINILVIILIYNGLMNTGIFAGIAAGLAVTYLLLRALVRKKVRLERI